MWNPLHIFKDYRAAKEARDLEFKKVKSIGDVIRAGINGASVEFFDEFTIPAGSECTLHYDLTNNGFEPTWLIVEGIEHKIKSIKIKEDMEI